MEDIKHTYTIQWGGPLTYDEYKEYVKGTDVLFFSAKCNNIVIFRENGTYAEGGDILLFPSKENRCWENVPIRYPNTKEELIDMLCKKNNKKMSDWDKAKEHNLYFASVVMWIT